MDRAGFLPFTFFPDSLISHSVLMNVLFCNAMCSEIAKHPYLNTRQMLQDQSGRFLKKPKLYFLIVIWNKEKMCYFIKCLRFSPWNHEHHSPLTVLHTTAKICNCFLFNNVCLSELLLFYWMLLYICLHFQGFNISAFSTQMGKKLIFLWICMKISILSLVHLNCTSGICQFHSSHTMPTQSS